MIVKTLQLRKNLKELLEISQDEDLFLDYYGQLFQITPVKKTAKKMTQAQKIVEYFSNRKPIKTTHPAFNEADPAQEKINMRNLRLGLYDE